jgi:hypothetical protein
MMAKSFQAKREIFNYIYENIIEMKHAEIKCGHWRIQASLFVCGSLLLPEAEK